MLVKIVLHLMKECQIKFAIRKQSYTFQLLLTISDSSYQAIFKLSNIAQPPVAQPAPIPSPALTKKGKTTQGTKLYKDSNKGAEVDKEHLIHVWAYNLSTKENIVMEKNSIGDWTSSTFDPNISCSQMCYTFWGPFSVYLWMDFGSPESIAVQRQVSQLTSLFTSQSHCDVKFTFQRARKETIGAHAAILSTDSPVFAAMFQHDLQEAKTRTVHIKDIEHVVFKRLLSYMYNSQVGNLDDEVFVQKLLVAADKYSVEGLKDQCELHLQSHITLENVLQLVVLAERHFCTKLYQMAMEFAEQRSQQICFLPSWKELILKHPNICLELTQRMAKKPQIALPPSKDSDKTDVSVRKSKRNSSYYSLL